MNIKNGEITDKQSIYVLPERSEITPFCTELTGISCDLLNKKGISFSEACKKITNEYQPKGRVWASYGEFDNTQFQEQCNDMKINNPMGFTHINIKSLIALKMKLPKAKGLKKVLPLINESLEGTHHNGADDAYNAAKVVRYILND